MKTSICVIKYSLKYNIKTNILYSTCYLNTRYWLYFKSFCIPLLNCIILTILLLKFNATLNFVINMLLLTSLTFFFITCMFICLLLTFHVTGIILYVCLNLYLVQYYVFNIDPYWLFSLLHSVLWYYYIIMNLILLPNENIWIVISDLLLLMVLLWTFYYKAPGAQVPGILLGCCWTWSTHQQQHHLELVKNALSWVYWIRIFILL